MNKKLSTLIFILAGTVLNIILMIIFIIGLTTATNTILLALDFTPNENTNIFSIAMISAMFGGMILAFFVYSKITKIIQNKYDLDKYLEPIFRRRRR